MDRHRPISPATTREANCLTRRAFYFTMEMVENRENMKAKIFNVITVLALCVAVQTSAQTTCQYVTIAANGDYAVQTNQIITLVGYDWYGRPAIYGSLPNGTNTMMAPCFLPTSAYSNGNPTGVVPTQLTQIFTGLTNVSVKNTWLYGGASGYSPGYYSGASATFKIETPATTTVISNYVPADAIVIPASATGNAQIILESSPDLVNWTAANPGTYGPSAGTNRFFRVRAAMTP